MNSTATNEMVQAASLAHIDLLDQFIRVTKDTLAGQSEAFVRDSLADLLSSLRDERDGYSRLVEAAHALQTAA